MINQVTNSCKGRRLCIFIHESLCYKLRKGLSVNSEAIESLSIEISNEKARNLIFSAIYRPLTEARNVFEEFCKDILSKNKSMKHIMFAGCFNMNVLDYGCNRKIKSFSNLIYQRNLIPAITKPTRVGNNKRLCINL